MTDAAKQIDPDRKKGCYEKYRVERLNDRAGKHDNCEYYVLDLVHDKFAPSALEAYAADCETEYPKLARDLRRKALEIRDEWAEGIRQ